MRGVKVTTRSGKRTLEMCGKCHTNEDEEIKLALEFNLIIRPVVTNIKQCEMCEDENEVTKR